MNEVVRKFVFEDEVIVVSNRTALSITLNARDDNGKPLSTTAIVDSYERTADLGNGDALYYQFAGVIEVVYDAAGIVKRGVRLEIVSVHYENGNPAYVSRDLIVALLMEGRDWAQTLMKVRRKQAAQKRDGYGEGLSIGDRMALGFGYEFVELAPAHKEDMDISAWNHSGSARVAAKAKARKADKRGAVSAGASTTAFDALFALEVK